VDDYEEIEWMWCCAHCGTLYAEEPERCECGWYTEEDEGEE
jgi:hypothetical protein